VPLPKRKLRVDRVSVAVVEGNFGRGDNVMTVELPADTIPLINCPVR
jgi:hypothetical protein